MTEKTAILLKTARREAGLTQEAAAELIPVSIRTLQRLEAGAGDLTLGVLGRMASVYTKPLLPLLCCNAEAAAQGVEPALIVREGLGFDGAVLRLIGQVYDFVDRHRDRQLIQLAADGKITPDEEAAFADIKTDLSALIVAAMQVQGQGQEVKPNG